ncbi:rhamnosyltransferase WsaF family glycosyltransferase [Halorientalis salina]|uniref:rhamnosyltransferase WsaF family glycosyltransferase n=1 Tax=Halorientalis salina TaxID=2932266 RepID=UPI0010AB50C1|nr:glycosyltransferase [Halorientalis salina]
MTGRSVLWLTPDKPDDISVGRDRIATHLENEGLTVEVRGTTAMTVAKSLRERGRFDVVVGTTRLGAITALCVSKAHGIPLVVDHVDPISQLRETESAPVVALVERLENLAFRLADHVFYVYPEEAARIQARASSSTETDLGVDYDRFATPDESVVDAARERLGTVPSNLAVYVGGLEPMYSVEAMLEGVACLDDWTLVVAGAGSLEPQVEAAAERSVEIRFLGTVPHEEVPGLLQLADVGLSLVDDPHTLKVLEYGAAGLPVVQLAGRAESRFGGLVEYCTTDPESVAGAIERADRSGKGQALQTYVAGFDWREITRDYVLALESITA